MNRFLLPLLFLFSTGHLAHAQITYEDFEPYTFVFDSTTNDSMVYRMMRPLVYDSLNPADEYPLFLWLHPNGNQGYNNMNQIKGWANEWANPNIRADYPGFILAPQLPPNTSWTGMMNNVIALLDYMKDTWSIDDDRVYIGGYSLGAFGVWSATLNHQSNFAAGFPIAGFTNLPNVTDLSGFPLWVFYGENDGSVAAARNLISIIRNDGGTPIYTEFPNVNHNNVLQTVRQDPDLMVWMYAQTKAGGNLPPYPTNLDVQTNGSIATLSWDMPALPKVDSIMAYHVYKNGVRLTQGLENALDTLGPGLSMLHRTQSFVDSSYTMGDSYEVTALNYRNQESDSTFVSTINYLDQPEVRIFPNPTRGLVQVEVDGSEIRKLVVFDVSGKRVLFQKPAAQVAFLDLTSFVSGVYLIRVQTESGVLSRRILKQ